MRIPTGILLIFWTCLALGAEQPTNTNVISQAEDAFGITLGPESFGLYSSSGVRGFSPLTAGNVRLNGLYFDQQGSLPDRLVTDTRIRVGLSAVDFPWPAPTGIVDYTMRKSNSTPQVTSVWYLGPNNTRGLDLDGSTDSQDGHLGIAAGAAYHDEEDLPGLPAHTASFAVLPQWTPSETLSISAFWGYQTTTASPAWPNIYLNETQSPPRIPVNFFGQDWTTEDTRSEHFGIFGYARLSSHWIMRLGVFRSISDTPRSYADLYENVSSAGTGDHTIIAFPNQYFGSTSGELQLSGTFISRLWRQKIDFGVRGRDLHAQYGGADSFDFGMGQAGRSQPLQPPEYHFGGTTADTISEYSPEASYSVWWNNRINLTAAVRGPFYSRNVNDPVLGQATTSTKPLLYNSSVTFVPFKSLTVFGALTRGLEDSGLAPASALNRGEILGAVRSSEAEVGLKYAISSSFTLLAGAFDIQKPYFALDSQDIFISLGGERHRGTELSLSGELIPGLHLVAGALLLTPEVLVRSTPQQVIGSRPVGQPSRVGQVGIDYIVPWLSRLSVDGSISAEGPRPASLDNRVKISGYAIASLGARYAFEWDGHSSSLRIYVGNVTGAYNWNVDGDGGLLPIAPRRVWAYFTADL